MYLYLTIRGDDRCRTMLPASEIREHLSQLPELVPVDGRFFRSSESSPWFRVGIHVADQAGDYGVFGDESTESANMVELVGSDDGKQKSMEFYLGLASRIALKLSWSLHYDDE